jgi:hypothetical protein
MDYDLKIKHLNLLPPEEAISTFKMVQALNLEPQSKIIVKGNQENA